MNRTKIADEIIQYGFAPDGGDFSTNILVVRDGDRALLIDSGYEVHAKAVRADLQANGTTIETVVLSHDHEDHSHGCHVLERSRVLVGPDFPQDILAGNELESVGHGDTFDFGAHHLAFFRTPGHSRCHLVTVIDSRYVHAGDLIVFTADGLPTPPYLGEQAVTDGGSTVDEHISSLEFVGGLKHEILLTGHGPVMHESEDVTRDIANRLFYLRALRDLDGPARLADCVPDDPDKYSRHGFHRLNLQKRGLLKS